MSVTTNRAFHSFTASRSNAQEKPGIAPQLPGCDSIRVFPWPDGGVNVTADQRGVVDGMLEELGQIGKSKVRSTTPPFR
eukprot:scaffold35402_cov30-Prasinocladus_malaysianus.AAC.1